MIRQKLHPSVLSSDRLLLGSCWFRRAGSGRPRPSFAAAYGNRRSSGCCRRSHL
jgi:hypothetical protein